MEVSRRRVLLRHLEPARPLRRCVHADIESPISAAAGDQDPVEQETTVGIEQVFKIFNLHKQKKVERISYTREVLIGLASCPEAKKRPEYLPDHPIVLPEARDPGQELRVALWNGVKEDV